MLQKLMCTHWSSRPLISWKLQVHQSVHIGLSLDPILSLIQPTLLLIFLRLILILSSHICLCMGSWRSSRKVSSALKYGRWYAYIYQMAYFLEVYVPNFEINFSCPNECYMPCSSHPVYTWLIPYSWVIHQNLMFTQLLRNFLSFMEPKFITLFSRTQKWSLT
jgi:hypothetical protein